MLWTSEQCILVTTSRQYVVVAWVAFTFTNDCIGNRRLIRSHCRKLKRIKDFFTPLSYLGGPFITFISFF